jgi:hypothetical protein
VYASVSLERAYAFLYCITHMMREGKEMIKGEREKPNNKLKD